MKLPKWLYPKDVITIKYWFHLFLDVLLVYGVILFFGLSIGSIFGVPLTFPSYMQGIIDGLVSPLFWIFVALFGLADITTHTLLRME